MIRGRILVFLICLCGFSLALAQAAAPQNPPAKVGVYRVGGGVSAPRVISQKDPEYSDEARRAHYEGTVVLWLIVGPDGLPHDVRVARSAGMGLDEKALEAVRQWRFEPALKDGQPVAVQINVEVNFRLPPKPDAESTAAKPTEIPQSRLGDPSAPPSSGAVGGAGTGQAGAMPPVFGTPAGRLGAPKRVRVSRGVAEVLLVDRVAPVYPPLAREAKIEGPVFLQAVIDKEGRVDSIHVLKGHPLLTQAAIDAVKQWKYKPYFLNGEPVEVETQIVVDFRWSD